jgi:hypothetical protein
MQISRFKNVFWDSANSKWRAIVTMVGAKHHIGRFLSEEDANAAVCKFKEENGLRESYFELPSIAESFQYRDGNLISLHNTSQYIAGDVVGCLNKSDGYVSIRHNGKLHQAHRVIWELHYGGIANGLQIDHVNHIRSDNRIENLRLVSSTGNARNHSLQSNNKTGIPGVKAGPCASYLVNIGHQGRQIHIGSFSDFFEACCARKSAEAQHGYHQNHGRAAS